MEADSRPLSAGSFEDVAAAFNILSQRIDRVEAESNALRQMFVSLVAVIGSGREPFVTRREIGRLLEIAHALISCPPDNLNPQLGPLVQQMRDAYQGKVEEARPRLHVVPSEPPRAT